MSRLTRYTQQIFGSTAAAAQIAEFGSFANGTPSTYSGSTITPAIVQTLSQYLSGWFNATEGAYSPAIEDMNALCYLFAYQLAYTLQVGIPEWDAGTTYYIGDMVQNGSGFIYVSLTNSNLNNSLSSSTNWSQFIQNGTITPNSLNSSITVPSGNTLTYPNVTIPNGITLTVNSGADLVVQCFMTAMIVASGGTLTILGTALII